MAKRTAEGKSKREIMRCLKRYTAREIYRQITNPQAAPERCHSPGAEIAAAD
jgi:transposase